jgi:ubiquinone/menaquinone biosynthesis C-methylase UbiE
MMTTLEIAKFLMKRFEVIPISPSDDIGELQEVFNHLVFLNGSESERREIMLRSSEASYRSETEYPWDHYFGMNLLPLLHGKTALDLGCFNGGRSIAWSERYQLKNLVGVDINPVYIDAATQFAAKKNIKAHFNLTQGESLPFENETFDAILSFEVFEHVHDVKKILAECRRVLKTNGRLFIVFPSYFHPFSHHLSLVTTCPCIHYLFNGKTLVQAYYDILQHRGSDAYWYARNSPYLEPWERCNTINGTTLAQFRRYLRNDNWEVFLHSRRPIGSMGRHASTLPVRLISYFFYPLVFIPLIQEVFIHRIIYILEKSDMQPIPDSSV